MVHDKPFLIVGIDPGTTLGYAMIDLQKNLVSIGSEKNLDIGALISLLIGLGRPLVIAGDKQNSPNLINKLAVKLGARAISPDYDLKVDEKRAIAGPFSAGNQHEIDALASALFAFRKISPTLKKIRIFVEHYKKEELSDNLICFVVGKGLSIRCALDIMENKEDENSRIIKNVVEEKKLTENDFLKLYQHSRAAKKDILLLKKQNNRLNEEIISLKKDYGCVLRKISKTKIDKKVSDLLDFREKRARFLEMKLKQKQEEISLMQGEITLLTYLLSNINSSILLKKLDNLGSIEFKKKEGILNICAGDILLVKDPDIISRKTIEELREKVDIIFYKKRVSKKLESSLPFAFIDAKKAHMEENRYFAILDKEDFKRVKDNHDLFHKIIEDYKKEKDIIQKK
ncbi:DUF460 domain-containing protein [Candidatus Woesearchaeota archaeon]|nr:DUF460 domain-containing protein [Candidatus Woesearchaeota archaeon]